MHFETFDEVMTRLAKAKRTPNLLLGNGFSMAYDPNIFSYNALYDFVASLKDPVLEGILGTMQTKNFELIMAQLRTFSKVLDVIGGGAELKEKVDKAHDRLQKSLMDAIQALHPEHVFKIPDDQSAMCAKFASMFLDPGGHVFTTNYDLLLYWVLMRQGVPNACDGFGRELLNPVEVADGTAAEDWSELIWGPNSKKQNVHYLHGALPLFDTGTDVVKEQYDAVEGYLLEKISQRINAEEYPVFVTAGNGDEKLSQIRHSPYLSHCYDKLCEVNGSVVTVGFGFGPYDLHILEALNRATHAPTKAEPKLWSIYVGVFSEGDKARIAEIEKSFHAKVHTFDVKTAPIWK